MNRVQNEANVALFSCINEISNRKKFEILELTQNREITVTILAKEVQLAYNKCSDYCARLQKKGLVEKKRVGREVLIRCRLDLNQLLRCFRLRN